MLEPPENQAGSLKDLWSDVEVSEYIAQGKPEVVLTCKFHTKTQSQLSHPASSDSPPS